MLILILLGVIAVWAAAASIARLGTDGLGHDGFAERNRPAGPDRIR
ncbi:hypothetical protein [Agromyces archimandritae]|uniref:Uncharacterized protein n=1 Tax=Agromyces archimandritae TaxID=2781962 RepID=A0A975FPF9_9MICO|nr:hypothetical protein [Agromyces archimandritae]QTX05248.1 hypothetical protein G127AT_03190 [Agromyces archimandritae]